MQLSHVNPDVPYVAFVYEADEFCNLVLNNSFLDHIHKVQRCHQSFTVCYITNNLMPYIDKRLDKLHICLQFFYCTNNCSHYDNEGHALSYIEDKHKIKDGSSDNSH